MFQLDDKFLEEMGLGGLPDDQKRLFLDHFKEQLELRVGTMLSQGLTDAQLEEFEAFIDRKEDVVNRWIEANAADYQNDPIYARVRSAASSEVPDSAVLAEYASLKWLSVNRPNYREVVAQALEELKSEVSFSRDAILGAQET